MEIFIHDIKKHFLKIYRIFAKKIENFLLTMYRNIYSQYMDISAEQILLTIYRNICSEYTEHLLKKRYICSQYIKIFSHNI